jgi:CheY-like chemotaxis protein
MAKSVLIVDDDVDILDSLELYLKGPLALRAFTASSGGEALQVLQQQPIDVVVTDFRMPGMDGCTFLDHAHNLRPNLPAILISAYSDAILSESECFRLKIVGFLNKPIDPPALKELLQKALDSRAIQSV